MTETAKSPTRPRDESAPADRLSETELFRVGSGVNFSHPFHHAPPETPDWSAERWSTAMRVVAVIDPPDRDALPNLRLGGTYGSGPARAANDLFERLGPGVRAARPRSGSVVGRRTFGVARTDKSARGERTLWRHPSGELVERQLLDLSHALAA
jgi:hypothetical protein